MRLSRDSGVSKAQTVTGRVFRSSRVHYGVLTASVSSITGLVITITQAHTVSLDDFARFAVSSAAYALVVGTVRATIAQPALALPIVDSTVMSSITRRALLCGLIAAVPLLLIGVIMSDTYLWSTAAALPGLALYDSIKTVRLAVSGPRAALALESVWAVVTVSACVAAWWGHLPGVTSYGFWMLSGALIGVVVTVTSKLPMRPSWVKGGIATSTSLAFGADYLIGGGAILLTTNILAVMAGSDVVAALRAAGTLLGPISLIIGILPTLLIPSLRVSDQNPSSTRGLAIKLGLLLTVVGIIPLGLVAFLPGSWGRLILGDTWPLAQPILPFLALDSLAVLATMVPFVGHRALLAGRASLIVRTGLACLRTLVTVWAGITLGASGAAVAMAAAACTGVIVWWVSYLNQLRARTSATHST